MLMAQSKVLQKNTMAVMKQESERRSKMLLEVLLLSLGLRTHTPDEEIVK